MKLYSFLLMFVCATTQADTSLIINLASYHFQERVRTYCYIENPSNCFQDKASKPWNQFNPGLGIQHNKYISGVYYDSIYGVSYYAGIEGNVIASKYIDLNTSIAIHKRSDNPRPFPALIPYATLKMGFNKPFLNVLYVPSVYNHLIPYGTVVDTLALQIIYKFN